MTRSFDEKTDDADVAAQLTVTGSFGMAAVAPVFVMIHKPLGSPLDPVWTCPMTGRMTFISVVLGAVGAATFQLKVAGGAAGGPIVTPPGPGTFVVPVPGSPVVPAGGDVTCDYTAGPVAQDAQLSVLVEP